MARALTPDEIMARVLHRDGLMLVIDKPAGIPVHRGPLNRLDKSGVNLEDSFDALRYGLPRPPVLAHRLDRETSGCLILGRHRKATASLGLMFKHGKIGKTYWAVVVGGPTQDEGEIDIPLGRLNAERGWWQKPDPDGLPSLTRWRVLGRGSPLEAATSPLAPSAPSPLEGEGAGGGSPAPPQAGEGADQTHSNAIAQSLTWLALTPMTGRTHQLRVHCAAMGWPIVGDTIYGADAMAARDTPTRFVPNPGALPLHLHAREIVVPLSKTKPPVRVTAPVPDHMRALLMRCGWTGADSAAI